jgi:ornithine carbamoyltransferase
MKRDFLSLNDLTSAELEALWSRTAELKAARAAHRPTPTLAGRVLGMIFEKASTRTRVSFEVGMFELGGHAVYLAQQGSQISRGEPIQDTARVLGGYCHGILIRTFGQHRAEALARAAPVPVINGLTDRLHPCQLLADLFTVIERRGGGGNATLRSQRFAWIGDGNNMAHSWINAAGILGLDLVLACPPGFAPDDGIVAAARRRQAAGTGGSIELTSDPREAARVAAVLSTDVWASMGQEAEAEERRTAFEGYIVDSTLLAEADPEAIVLHCLPAHRGEEISAEVIDGPRSAVWDQAENRLHAQKAALELLLA